MASHGIPRVSGVVFDKSAQAREKERKQIEQYKAIEREVRVKIKARDYSNETFQLTSKLLNQNPEYYTIWNYRRLLLQDVMSKELASNEGGNGVPSTIERSDAEAARKAGHTPAQQEVALLIQEDLQFLIPLLKQFPKCYWIWNHRSWLLSTATKHLPVHTAMELWQAELGLVSKMLALDSRNFHGWGYRREVVQDLERLSGQSMVEAEYEYTTKMIKTNLSNFSAWHNRGQLIPRLLSQRNATAEDRKTLFDAEFELITAALYTDPYDQSLWFYHQYLMSALDAHNPHAPVILQRITEQDRAYYLSQEIDSVREMLDGAEDSKYIYQALLDYSRRHNDVEDTSKKVTSEELVNWLDKLRDIDPLRKGRWDDLANSMKL